VANSTKHFRDYWPALPAVAIYFILAHTLNFTQDDAYISYRYVANYLNGDGLVFNVGERIEGFTNFGWTVYMMLLGVLGLDYISISKLTGALFGGGVVVLAFLLARRLFGKDNQIYILVATLLVGVNQSLAYWSPAGLETAAFAFFAVWSLYAYVRRSWLLIFTLVMAVWIRPEGAVVTGVLILIEAIQTRRLPRFALTAAIVAFVLSLPMVGFKIAYYGSILPNPFFAKTSFAFDQLANGWEYTARYLEHYTFYYVGSVVLIVPFLIYRQLSRTVQAVWLFALMYVAYITFIGGDVLKVHRFFLPLFVPMALLTMALVRLPLRSLKKATQLLILTLFGGTMLALTYTLPQSFVQEYRSREIAFMEKMQFKARQFLETDSTDFSVAVGTIGIFGYELLGHDIVDLVGLTDSTIARYSEEPIQGMETTWKEQKHNTRYLLERAPDYIMFSTGIKPSAPAERALLLYRQFLDSYRTVGWFYQRPGMRAGVITSAFKRVRPIEGEIVPVYPVEYVQEYKKGLDAHTTGDHRTAIQHYDRSARASPRPYFVYLVYQKAFSLQMLGQFERSQTMLNALLARDSTIFEAHKDLYRYAAFQGDSARMAVHRDWLLKLVPWYWPRVESMTREALAASRQGS
jgi:hypothetical protein